MKEKLFLRIYSDGVELQLGEHEVRYESELNAIAKKIRNEEIEVEVFYDDKPTSLYLMQGGVGAKDHGWVAPLMCNPVADVLLAICSKN